MQRKKRIVRRLAYVLAALLIVGAAAAWFAYPRILTYTLPFDDLFRRSKPELDAYAAKVMSPGSIALANPPDRLGYFNVLKVERLSHGFLFQHDSCSPFDWCGIAYSEDALPHEEMNAKGEVKQVSTSLGGKWYNVFRP